MTYVDIGRETVPEFQTGHGEVSVFQLPVATTRDFLKGVVIKADLDNPGNLYVGGPSVVVGAGFELDAGEQVIVPVNDPSKVYVVSDQGTNEQQTVAIDNATTSGHFHLTFGGQETGEIAYNASAADVKAALEALSTIDQVAVTGGPGPSTNWVVEFQGTLAAQDVALMTGDGTALVGGSTTVTVTETTPGDPAAQGYSWLGV